MTGTDAAGPDADPLGRLARLPRGRIPTVGIREIVAALHRRRERRRESVKGIQEAFTALATATERHLARIQQLKDAVEAQGGDLAPLQHYDDLMARLRAELRAAEKGLAEVFRQAAGV